MAHTYYTKYNEYPHINFFITYKNIYGNIIKREYESDLDYLKDVNFLTSESETLEMSLYKIKDEFHETNKKLNKIKKEFNNANSKLNAIKIEIENNNE